MTESTFKVLEVSEDGSILVEFETKFSESGKDIQRFFQPFERIIGQELEVVETPKGTEKKMVNKVKKYDLTSEGVTEFIKDKIADFEKETEEKRLEIKANNLSHLQGLAG